MARARPKPVIPPAAEPGGGAPSPTPSRRSFALRIALAAAGFIVIGIAAYMPVLQLRLSLAGVGAVSLVAALLPDHAAEFVRREWLSILRLIFSVAVTLLLIILLLYSLTPGWKLQLARALTILAELTYVIQDKKFRGWLKFLTIDQWRAIDAETKREPGEAGNTSWKVGVVLVVAAVSLTLQEYIGDRGAFESWFRPHGKDEYFELKGFAWWSSWRVIGYVIMPIITITLMPRERLRDYHLSPRGFFHHFWIYVTLFVLVLPAVVAASTTQSFRHTYPFYRLANRSHFDLWTWEAFYAAQFLSLEIFFRGFLLQGLRRVAGANAIFVMIVPYCMIHYGKPLPETLGAIFAGIILGTLAMRTRSIWGGVMIHVGVALTMDVLALRGCPPIGSGRWCGS